MIIGQNLKDFFSSSMEEVSLNIISIEYSLNPPNYIYDDTICELFSRDIKTHVPEVYFHI
jgi:hypothetical protein